MRQRGIRVFIVGTAALSGCGPGAFHNTAQNLTAATLVWIRHRLLAQWVVAQGALIMTCAVLSTTMALQLGALPLLYAAGSSGRGGGGGGSSHHFLMCTHKHTERSVPYTKVRSTSSRTPLKRVVSKLPLHRHHSQHASIFPLFHTVLLRESCKTHTHAHTS